MHKVHYAGVRVRVGLVQVEGVLLVAADDGVAAHSRPGLDLEQPPGADDGALGEGRAHVGERRAGLAADLGGKFSLLMLGQDGKLDG